MQRMVYYNILFCHKSDAHFAGNQNPAKIWGFEGEAWKTELLLDYSFTGFAAKERGFPEPPFAANILDFGAVGDGELDCTGVFFTSS